MAFVRTSRSLLKDRVVRVDRRRRIDDGMGGRLGEYHTIIPQLWCSIFPAHHQPRAREELGEVAEQRHFGIADPSRNGTSIMVGDRWVDTRNNECYLVEGVERPRPGSSYNAMHRFHLRVEKDCPPEAS